MQPQCLPTCSPTTWYPITVDADDHAAHLGLQRLVIERIALPYGEVWVAEDAGGRDRERRDLDAADSP